MVYPIGQLGVARNGLPLENISDTISTPFSLTNYLAELAAVEGALTEYCAAILRKTISPNDLTIFTDSQYVLQTLLCPSNSSGWYLVYGRGPEVLYVLFPIPFANLFAT